MRQIPPVADPFAHGMFGWDQDHDRAGFVMSEMAVSVVVCTYNRARELESAVESLLQQDTGDDLSYEVLVVDNASTDETRHVIDTLVTQSDGRVRGCFEPKPGVAMARNLGVQQARGDWIAFFDDDQVADRNWLAGLVETARKNAVRVVLGERRLLLRQSELRRLPPVCRRALGELVSSNIARRYAGLIDGSTGNMLVHRSVFVEIGLFSEATVEGGEDADLFRRIRDRSIEAWYTPEATVFHSVPPYRQSEGYFRWTSRRQGVHVARREFQTWGTLTYPAILLARVAQAFLVFLPRRLWSDVSGSPSSRLASRCDLWRAEGCLRAGLSLLAPRLLPQDRFFDDLDFRDEREIFGGTGPQGEADREGKF